MSPEERAEIVKYGLLFGSAVLGVYYVGKGAIGDDTRDPTPEEAWQSGSDAEQLVTFWLAMGMLGYLTTVVGEMPAQFEQELRSITQ